MQKSSFMVLTAPIFWKYFKKTTDVVREAVCHLNKVVDISSLTRVPVAGDINWYFVCGFFRFTKECFENDIGFPSTRLRAKTGWCPSINESSNNGHLRKFPIQK